MDEKKYIMDMVINMKLEKLLKELKYELKSIPADVAR